MQEVRPKAIGDIMRGTMSIYNDNVSFSKRNNNDNVLKNRLAKSNHVDWIADRLVKEFRAPTSRRFFAKVGWLLPENEIWEAVEYSKRPCIQFPVKYFVRICNTKLHKLGK